MPQSAVSKFFGVVMITSFFILVGELIQKVSDHSFFSKVSSQVRPGTTKSLARYYLRQEPGALVAHAGICAGGTG